MSAARTLPVTPAERCAATILRAYLDYQPAPRDYDGERGLVALIALVETGARNAGLVGKWTTDATPAGAALLARVEADRIAEDIARELVIKLQTGGAPGYVVCDAQVLLTSCIRLAALARLAATTPIDAPPAKEPR